MASGSIMTPFGFPELIRVIAIALNIACLVGFAPAVVHARDNVDRFYLLGGAAFLVGSAGGSVVRLHAPFNGFIFLTIAGELLWIVSALMSKRRRRQRLASTSSGGGHG